MKKVLTSGSFLIIAFIVLIQLVPIGRNHTNPAVTSEPSWDSTRTRDLAKRACFDCHSNETVWPWYSNIAPVSWLVQRDVDEGRQVMNFSEWNTTRHQRVGEMIEAIQEGFMPPINYLPTHPQANLSASEKADLINGLQATLSR